MPAHQLGKRRLIAVRGKAAEQRGIGDDFGHAHQHPARSTGSSRGKCIARIAARPEKLP
jgi:hypothetical protein